MAGNDSFTKILLHFDTSVTTDMAAGRTPVTWTNVNAVTAGTTSPTPKFGTSSAHFVAASSQGLTTPHDADWSPAGDFTIDCWVYWTGTNGQAIVAHFDGALNGWFWGIGTTTSGKLSFAANINAGAGATLTSATSIPTNAWTHIAVIRVGGFLKQFINGTEDVNALSVSVQAATATLSIGYQAATSGSYFGGNIDEFRYSNGVLRWTASFTPPTAAYGIDTTLTASVGAYLLTGVAVGLLRPIIRMVAATGSYVLTGMTATTLRKAWLPLTAAVGSYTLTGIAVNFPRGIRMVAATGTYALTGIAATVKKALRMTMATGTYTLTGMAAIVKKALHLRAATGSYILTGIALVVARTIAPASKFARRLAAATLYRRRVTPPTL